MNRSSIRYVPAILALGGALLLGFSVVTALNSVHLQSVGVKASSEIISLVSQGSGKDGRPNESPEVRFTDQEGVSQTALLRTGSDSYRVGGNIDLLYNPSAPSNVVVESWFGRWGTATLAAAVGAGSIVMALIAFIAFRPKEPALEDALAGVTPRAA